MPTHIRVNIGKHHEREHSAAHRDEDQQTPGWAKAREPKDEPPAKSLSLNPEKWTAKAAARSGPAWAPGLGSPKKSS
jgi:hypothetical protein